LSPVRKDLDWPKRLGRRVRGSQQFFDKLLRRLSSLPAGLEIGRKYARTFILDRNCNTAKNSETPIGLWKHPVGFLLPCAAELNCFIKGRRNCMAWTAPHFEEVQLNCEINSYVSAQL